MNFVTYNKLTGAITANGKAPRLDWLRPISKDEANLAVDGEYDPATHYVDLRQMKVFPKRPSRVGAVGNTLEGLPVGGKLHVNGQTYAIEEERVELSFNIPGPHTVRVTSTEFLETAIVLPDQG